MASQTKSPTLSDVAQRAGVSYATADRVVNARGHVAEKSARKVTAAVAELGYVRNVAAANLSQQREYRFVFVFPDGANAFFARMRDILAARQPGLSRARTRIEVAQVPAFEPEALAAHLERVAQSRPDGVAVVGIDSAAIAAPLAALRGSGVPVVSLVSDLPETGRNAYIGIDNLMAGRMAARLLGLSHGGRAGKALVVLGALNARDHRDRLAGFHAVLRRDFGAVAVLPEIEGRDRAEVVEARVSEALARDPDISAIYCIGGGRRGLRRALERHGRPVFCIVHDLLDHTRAGLEEGLFDVVLDQRPEEEIDTALSLMRALGDRVPLPPRAPLLPMIFLRDNLPPQP